MRFGRCALLLAAALAVLAVPGEAQARYEGDFNLFVGQKWFHQGDWAPVDEQPELGLMLAFGEERAPVHFSIDLFMSKDEADFVDPVLGAGQKRASTLDFAIGVRKTWRNRATCPHLGAGADAVRVHLDSVTASATDKRQDHGYGAWVEAGLSWRLAGHLNLGIEARYSKVNVDLGTNFTSVDTAAGGFHAGLLLGYGW